MMDGKNLFDHHTSFVGEWHVDETIEKYVKQNGKGMIVVGIDSAIDGNDRRDEMLIESKVYEKKMLGEEAKDLKGKGSVIANYIFTELKPMIDDVFFTKPDRDNTGVGGSSMGGLYAFYLGTKYKNQVAFSLCFTPAFAFYKKKLFIKDLKKYIKGPKSFGKYFFFVGGIGLEKVLEPLTTITANHLSNVGFDEKQVRYIYDSAQVHNEEPWSFYFDVAIKWWGILEK
jgi:predicted alpha/beta superfamily hydrolase